MPQNWKVTVEEEEERDERETILWRPIIFDLKVEGDEVFTKDKSARERERERIGSKTRDEYQAA